MSKKKNNILKFIPLDTKETAIVATPNSCSFSGDDIEEILSSVANIIDMVKREYGNRAFRSVISALLASCTEEERRDISEMVAELIK